MKFGTIRKSALEYWTDGTGRQRIHNEDYYDKSFECNWQLGFKPYDPLSKDHYSIFCSMGDWNTLITDLLDDKRYDSLDLNSKENHQTLFRHYTMLFLVFSEVMTDFQDVLTVLRLGSLVTPPDRNKENKVSRTLLEKFSPAGYLQNWFDFINTVSKHKTKNIHGCNHHIFLWFEDSRSPCLSKKTINMTNVKEYMNGQLGYIGDTVIVPSLELLLKTILDGYIVLNEEFKADPARFETFRNLYKGVSLQ